MVKRLGKMKTLRKSSRRKTLRKSSRRKTKKRKSSRRKTMKGGIIGMQCGKEWKNKDKLMPHNYGNILGAKNNRWRTSTLYTIQMKIRKKNSLSGKTIREIIKIPNMKLKDIKKLRNRIKKNERLNSILKVGSYSFNEFLRGNKSNCIKRFTQINDFFREIESKIERAGHRRHAGEEMKIIKILQSMNKLPNNFMPEFEDVHGTKIWDGVRITYRPQPGDTAEEIAFDTSDWV